MASETTCLFAEDEEPPVGREPESDDVPCAADIAEDAASSIDTEHHGPQISDSESSREKSPDVDLDAASTEQTGNTGSTEVFTDSRKDDMSSLTSTNRPVIIEDEQTGKFTGFVIVPPLEDENS